MAVVAVVGLWVIILALALLFYRQTLLHDRAFERLGAGGRSIDSPSDMISRGDPESPAAQLRRDAQLAVGSQGGRRLERRFRWMPWAVTALAVLVMALGLGWPLQYTLALGTVVLLLAIQLESYLAAKFVAKLENQLADAIDIMVGALGAGAAVTPALEAAITEIEPPLRPYLEEISGRIGLGDDPVEVFRSLSHRVPLETFLHF
jgi:tight adherence protein B